MSIAKAAGLWTLALVGVTLAMMLLTPAAPVQAQTGPTDPCGDPNTGALDNAEAAGLDLATGLVWSIENRTTRPQQGEEKVDVLAQGFTRALCFLKSDY